MDCFSGGEYGLGSCIRDTASADLENIEFVCLSGTTHGYCFRERVPVHLLINHITLYLRAIETPFKFTALEKLVI